MLDCRVNLSIRRPNSHVDCHCYVLMYVLQLVTLGACICVREMTRQINAGILILEQHDNIISVLGVWELLLAKLADDAKFLLRLLSTYILYTRQHYFSDIESFILQAQ
jgi:hypothetical protein